MRQLVTYSINQNRLTVEDFGSIPVFDFYEILTDIAKDNIDEPFFKKRSIDSLCIEWIAKKIVSKLKREGKKPHKIEFAANIKSRTNFKHLILISLFWPLAFWF